MAHAVFIGVDVGTQGVRVMALSENGNLLASHSYTFSMANDSKIRIEQSANLWWKCVLESLINVANELAKKDKLKHVVAVSVTSTSGTILPVDRNYQAIHHALMYSDPRSEKEAAICKDISKNEDLPPFNSSYGLPKVLWFINNFPEKTESIYKWCHASDFIIGKLSGIWGVTDYTNSLKTGYNLANDEWPDFISTKLNLPSSWFPTVVRPGTILGRLSSETAALTGLLPDIKVVAGLTDGCASQIAAGSLGPGQWNTTIGTTMVIKGVTKQRIIDPYGRLYNHKHPRGYWMPGGASNTGADWVSKDFAEDDLILLNGMAGKIIPSNLLSYPLQQQGERFPFVSERARGFDPPKADKFHLFTSRMEGVSFIERLSYEMIEDLSGEKIKEIYTAGGASKSDVWLSIRSNVLKKPIYKMKHVEGAVGAALTAAAETYFSDIEEAGSNMLIQEKIVEPGSLTDKYDELYHLFKKSLQSKGYLTN
ncbi:carbohydrate kinase [Bacillus sp. V5-8f]|nr:carbohydrate kinase [Bacillus sp. V5-8f]